MGNWFAGKVGWAPTGIRYESDLGTMPDAQGWGYLFDGSILSLVSGDLHAAPDGDGSPNHDGFALFGYPVRPVGEMTWRLKINDTGTDGYAGFQFHHNGETTYPAQIGIRSDGLIDYSGAPVLLAAFDATVWRIYKVNFSGGNWHFFVDGIEVYDAPSDLGGSTGAAVLDFQDAFGAGFGSDTVPTFDLDYLRVT